MAEQRNKKIETSEWSEPYLLTSGHHLAVGDRPGVYRIRAFSLEGNPIPIGRVDGVDPNAILHIGQSVRLGTRVREFKQAAEGKRAQHPAGKQFYRWGFQRMFPLRQLRFDYVFVQDVEEAIRLERRLHEDYRRQYLDKPPLDAQSGRSD